MYKIVLCLKFKNIYLGLNRLPKIDKLGFYIFKNFCKKFWLKWLKKQTILINENNLNFINNKHINYLIDEIKFLFIKKNE